MEEAQVIERLRDRIVTALHVGRVRPGDRLPGVREVARDVGANPRTVAKAYRRLEAEGLVEVRGRSGVYAARQDHWGGGLLAETGRWLGGVLLEAWKRNIPIPDLADLIRRCTERGALRAACIDETEDERRAVCAELEEAFGLRCSAFAAADLPADPTDARTLPRAVRQADLIVTSPYVARAARPFAEALDTPMVVISLHSDRVVPLARRVADGALAVVCVDEAFGDKVRSRYPEPLRPRVRVILADDKEGLAELRTTETPVHVTRAARERLGERAPLALIPLAPYISPESAGEIAELMVLLHMHREHGSTDAP